MPFTTPVAVRTNCEKLPLPPESSTRIRPVIWSIWPRKITPGDVELSKIALATLLESLRATCVSYEFVMLCLRANAQKKLQLPGITDYLTLEMPTLQHNCHRVGLSETS